jgi:hypothetical protein
MTKAFIIAFSLAVASVAQASIQLENVAVLPSSSGVSGTISFNVPQFDPALGTLNGVTLTLTPTFGDFGSSAFNNSASTLSAVSFTVSAVSGSLKLGATTLASYSSSQSLTSPTYSVGSFAFVDGPALPFSFTSISSPVAVSAVGFTGLGNDSLAVTGSATATSGGTGNPLFAGFYGNVGGNLEVDYSYTPVPEATTLISGALLLLPFGASTLRGLRRTRAA